MSKRNQLLYLNDILDSVNAIFNFIENMGFDDFVNDRKTISAVIREFEVIGEAVNRLPEDIKKQYKEIEWRDIVDFRNLLIHQYFGVDLDIIWDTINSDLMLLKNVIIEIISKQNS